MTKCTTYCFDEHKVETIKHNNSTYDYPSISNILKTLGDERRLRIMHALTQEMELCVCDLSIIIDATIANTSHHLRKLHGENMVDYRKDGKLVFYSITNPQIKKLVLTILD